MLTVMPIQDSSCTDQLVALATHIIVMFGAWKVSTARDQWKWNNLKSSRDSVGSLLLHLGAKDDVAKDNTKDKASKEVDVVETSGLRKVGTLNSQPAYQWLPHHSARSESCDLFMKCAIEC